MKYDTGGRIIKEMIQNCDCGLTGGCEKCNPLCNPLLGEHFEEGKDCKFERVRCPHCGQSYFK